MGALESSNHNTVPLRAISQALSPGLAALLFAAAAEAYDSPYRMKEATAGANHVAFTANGLWGYADASGEYALVTTGGTLAVIDVTDPTRPVVASRVPTTGFDLKEVKTYRHYAYCVNQQGPLQIVDLSDPYHAYTAANFISESFFGAHNIWIEEDGYAYLALLGTGTQDLRILDLREDPLRPRERGYYAHPLQRPYYAAHDVYVRNDTCYASWFFAGLAILDVRDKDLPRPIHLINYPYPATHNAWPTLDGRFVCTTDEQGGGHLRIWDIANPQVIQQVAEYATEATAIIHNVHLKGTHAYIAYYAAGVRVVDLSNPFQPREVGRFDTSRFSTESFRGCWSVFPYPPSGLIYASDREDGLYVLRFLDARDGVLKGSLRVHGAEAARVSSAEVRFLESEVRVVSDRAGYFQARLPEGTYTGVVSAPGFYPETFTAEMSRDGLLNLTIILDPLSGAGEFVGEPDPPLELADNRLRFEARIREHGTPFAEVLLHYRAGSTGGFRALPMERVADDERYRAFTQELLPGMLVHYYFEVRDENGVAAFYPPDAPATLLSHQVGKIDWQRVYYADFESSAVGFTVGAAEDQGSNGIWERAIPVASSFDSLAFGGRLPQPHTDTTPVGPGYCFLTELGVPGESPETHEVDGRTTLISPSLALDGAEIPVAAGARLRLMLWYVNDLAGSVWQDAFLIEGSSDGGATWRVLESIRVADPGWQAVNVDLGRRIDLRSGRVKVRFVAQDYVDGLTPTLIEAAVDDIVVEVTSGIKAVEVAGRPAIVLLRQNIPNPFNPTTTISYQLKEPRQVKLAIYDVAGHLIKVLTDRLQPVGDHAVTWDGRDVRGFDSPSGVYFYHFEAQDFTESRRMLLLK